MKEPTMPVQIFLDGREVLSGDLVSNGGGLALCSGNGQAMKFSADTELVEAKIPMQIKLDNQMIGEGEFYQSGEYYCLCPADQSLDLMDPDAVAQLFIEKQGLSANLEIKKGH